MEQNARTLTKNVEHRHVAWPPAAQRTIRRTLVRLLRRTVGRVVGRIAAVSLAALLALSVPVVHAPPVKASEAAKAPRLFDIADRLLTNAVLPALGRRRVAGFPHDRLQVASPGCDHIHAVAPAPQPMRVDLLARTRGPVPVATRRDACVALREMPA